MAQSQSQGQNKPATISATDFSRGVSQARQQNGESPTAEASTAKIPQGSTLAAEVSGQKVSTAAPSTSGPKVVSAPGNDTEVEPRRAPSFTIQSNINAVRWLKLMVYGEYGSGKTLLAGTSVAVPAMRDVLMISAEAGDLTLFDPDNSNVPFPLIDIVHVTDYKTAARVHDFLKIHCSVRDKAASGDKEAINTLMKLQNYLLPDVPDPDRLRLYRTNLIDTLTEVETFCMMQLLGINDMTLLDEESTSPEWAQYSAQRMMIHRLIRNFRNLPMNTVFTCQRQFRENEKKIRVYAPQMTGKLAGEIQGFMDLVGHLVVGEAQPTEDDPDPAAPRRMYIQPGPRFSAKNRFRKYRKSYFDNPDMRMIVEAIGLPTLLE